MKFRNREISAEDIDRFFSKIPSIVENNECWEWQGTLHKSGYAIFSVGYRNFYAHRVSYCIATGTDPQNMDVCHSCDNPKCVNPNHLFLGSHLDNMRDCFKKGRMVSFKGSKNGTSKLKEVQVIDIRRRYANGGVLMRELADEFRVSLGLISHIVHRLTWRHV